MAFLKYLTSKRLIAEKKANKIAIAFLRSRSSFDLLTKWRSPITHAFHLTDDLALVKIDYLGSLQPFVYDQRKTLVFDHKKRALFFGKETKGIFYFA